MGIEPGLCSSDSNSALRGVVLAVRAGPTRVRRVRAADHGPVGAAGVGTLVARPLPALLRVPRRPRPGAQLLHARRPTLLQDRLCQVSES